MTEFLNLLDLLKLVDDLNVGPVRDLGLLESAVARPQTKLWGNDAYDNLDLKAAALLESIVRNHALIDGNKRLGWLATVVFFAINDVTIEGDDDDIYNTVIDTARDKISLEDLSAKLASWHQGNGSQNEKYPKPIR